MMTREPDNTSGSEQRVQIMAPLWMRLSWSRGLWKDLCLSRSDKDTEKFSGSFRVGYRDLGLDIVAEVLQCFRMTSSVMVVETMVAGSSGRPGDRMTWSSSYSSRLVYDHLKRLIRSRTLSLRLKVNCATWGFRLQWMKVGNCSLVAIGFLLEEDKGKEGAVLGLCSSANAGLRQH